MFRIKKAAMRLLMVTTSMLAASFVGAANEVRLKHAHFTPVNEKGLDYAELEGAIEVKNLGPVKNLWLHYKNANGVWVDHPAFYVAPTSNGYEAFAFRLPLHGNVSDIEFAIKYQVNAQTYWDNNDTRNYVFNSQTQTAFKHQSVAVDDATRSYSQVSITARARYASQLDKVTLVYSVDHWQTQQRRVLSLSQLTSDASGNSGIWQGTQYVEYYRPFDYYLEYESSGQVAIDNYYGKGYRLQPQGDSFGKGPFKQRYPQLYFRGEPTAWTSLSMSLIADYTWSIMVYFDGSTDFKFDAYNDWSRNFGDSNHDGVIDLNGANMQVPTAGSIQITVNTQTGKYKIEPYY